MENNVLKNRKLKAEINVVPYIDVMLVLLIIFMVVAPLTITNMIDLPSSGYSNQPPTRYIKIELDNSDQIKIGMQGQKKQIKISRDKLFENLQQLFLNYSSLPVMISADKSLKYDEVVKTIDSANKAGFMRVGLATR
tara:strand:+ start:231 stop:641 length:411 start_codon:yes stop_codon:yes gene_type:complete